jgi:hypothetical protein
MFGAAYFPRIMPVEKLKDSTIDPDNRRYTDAIAGDLLNPLFSSFVARDLFHRRRNLMWVITNI